RLSVLQMLYCPLLSTLPTSSPLPYTTLFRSRFILRPLIGESPLSVIMVTIGLSQFLRAIVEMFYGTSVREMPAILPTGSVNFLRSEEHTSGLQSRFDIVCLLLLDKKYYIVI